MALGHVDTVLLQRVRRLFMQNRLNGLFLSRWRDKCSAFRPPTQTLHGAAPHPVCGMRLKCTPLLNMGLHERGHGVGSGRGAMRRMHRPRLPNREPLKELNTIDSAILKTPVKNSEETVCHPIRFALLP